MGRKQKLFSQGLAPGDDTGIDSTPQCLPYFQTIPTVPRMAGAALWRTSFPWEDFIKITGREVVEWWLWWWKCFSAVAVVVETFPIAPLV